MGVSNDIWGLQLKSRGLQQKSGVYENLGVSNENLGVFNENLEVSNDTSMGVSDERGLQKYSNDDDFFPDSNY